MYADTLEDAESCAKDAQYWPLEIADYSTMQVIINDGAKETILIIN